MEEEEEGGAKACVVVVDSSNASATDTIIGKHNCMCIGGDCCCFRPEFCNADSVAVLIIVIYIEEMQFYRA